jgi:tyrosine-protein kinase Etk/Wzc
MAFIVEHLDTSLGTIEEMETLLQLPVLGVIPYLSSPPKDRGGGVAWGDSEESLQTRRRRERGKPEVQASGSVLRNWFIRVFAGRQALTKKLPRREELRHQLVLNYSPTSPIAEAYRILVTNALKEEGPTPGEVSGTGKPRSARVILLTSTGPQEGKTITAANLAITMAQKGATVLLVDLDLRKSALHKVFGLDKEPGLSNLLQGTSQIDSAVRTIADTLIGSATAPGLNWEMVIATPGIDNLHILPAGSTILNPAEVLGSAEMNRILGELRMKYDYLVCDCPPILPVTDVLVVGPKPDTTVVLIYRAGRTAKGALVRAKEQLTTAGIKIKGIVLNYMSPEIEVSPTYYYHYYKYYPSEKK